MPLPMFLLGSTSLPCIKRLGILFVGLNPQPNGFDKGMVAIISPTLMLTWIERPEIVMNCLIARLHFTEVTRDRVCLVYALITWLPINIVVVIPKYESQDISENGFLFKECITAWIISHQPINLRSKLEIFKLKMHKTRVHLRRRYTFGGLITKLCREAGIPKDIVDYMAPFFTTYLHITKTMGPETMHGSDSPHQSAIWEMTWSQCVRIA